MAHLGRSNATVCGCTLFIMSMSSLVARILLTNSPTKRMKETVMKKLGSFGGMLVILLAGCAVWAQTFADSTSPDETLAWNDTLLDALFTAGTNPPTALRCAAIMNTAIFDAYNG